MEGKEIGTANIDNSFKGLKGIWVFKLGDIIAV